MKVVLRGLLALACVVCVSGSLYAANRAHEEELWRSVGLSTEFLNINVLNPRVCYGSDILLYGCVRTIDSLLSEPDSKDVTLFTTSAWLEKLQQFSAEDKLGTTYSVEKDLGFYKIVKAVRGKPVNQSQSDIIAEIMKDKDRDKQERDHWKQTLSGINGHPIPFADIMAWVKQNRVTAANESMVVGTAFDVFLMTAVDAHSYVLPTQMLKEESNGTSDDYSGIGVSIKSLNGKIIIPQPFEGGPGYKAGLKSNDVILEVNGKDISGMTTEQVADIVQGASGTPVTLKIQRKTQVFTLTIVRAKIHQENVTWVNDLPVQDSRTREVHHVGYLKIRSFMTANLCATVAKGLNNLQSQKQKIEAIIFDLRDNPGGDLNEAACIAGLFVGRNKLVVEQRSLDEKVAPSREVTSTADKIVNVPVVTLVNSNSASAAEILSGDLQDYQVGPIVGVRTWGKATVQALGPWSVVPGTTIAMTIARFYLPGNKTRPRHTNQIVGIIPDVEVYDVPNPTEVDKFAYREADLSPIVLSQKDNETQPPYPQLTAYYQNCIQQHGEAQSVYNANQNAQVAPDYQRLVGLDVAMCAGLKKAQENPGAAILGGLK